LERLRAALSYDPETGNFTRLAGPRKGKNAGYRKANGYVTIWVNRRDYFAHRLAWLYVHGEWPLGHIDHISLDPSDNSIKNLRVCTPSQNMRNARRTSRNKTGVKGVSWIERRRKWRAQICVAGTHISLGHFATLEAAASAYATAAAKYHGEFARPDMAEGAA
jgi:hypothetical protein